MKIFSKILVINGAPLEGVSPLPKFRSRKAGKVNYVEPFPKELKESAGVYEKALPYLMQDRYSRKRIPLKLKCIVLENEYLKAEFLPEYGGRLHSLYDKTEQRELIMTNTVIQPCNLAIRNAWLSGGIEWNVGSLGHTYTTCDNVFVAKLNDTEGNEFIRIYEFERLKNIFWQIDFHLPDGSKQLISHVKMINPFDRDTTTYWWSNIAVPDTGKTRILSSEKYMISFVNSGLAYERLPHMSSFEGKDMSYAQNASRSFDFFIQPENMKKCTWEAAAYEDGLTFFERSTPPLSYKKLFGWGSHPAGFHWQEFLSEPGKGYYAEMQAGIAPSQLHDKILKANSKYEWTQCFGGLRGDKNMLHAPDFDSAAEYLGELIDAELDEKTLNALDKKLEKLASLKVSADMIIHNGSGFGAVEAMRMECDKDGTVPASMCFPASTVGKAEYPWVYLLKEGVLPVADEKEMLTSFMVNYKWREKIKKSLEMPGGRHWYSLMQYGVMEYEISDNSVYVNAAHTDENIKEQAERAEKIWLESIAEKPSYWVYRNLAVLEKDRGQLERAEMYYDKALGMEGCFDDFGLVSEYLGLLSSTGKYEKLWQIYSALPDNCKSKDRIKIYAANAAVKLDKFDYIENFFKEEHYDIREGECSLTDVWFEFCAKKLARERNIEFSGENAEKLLDEVWESCPPPKDIDFRQSYNRNNKYRV